MTYIIEMNMDIDKVLRNSFLNLTRLRLQKLEEQAKRENQPSLAANMKQEKTTV